VPALAVAWLRQEPLSVPLASAPVALLPVPRAEAVMGAAELRLLMAAPAAFEMESALAPMSPQQAAPPQRVALQGEEREARWRLELAETRTHPFQSAKFFPAAPTA
jgi:hypothetical protein